MFDERANQDLPDIGEKNESVEQFVTFTALHINIHEKLSEKKFEIRVRCKFTLRDNQKHPVKAEDLDNYSIDVGYEKFFDLVNSVFGDDPLVSSV